MIPRFRNRVEAGQLLATRLHRYAQRTDVMVLALPRGGVPVAYEIARALNAPLDVLLVRKLGMPGHEELAMGAIASGGICVLNEDLIQALHIPEQVLSGIIAREQQELERRARIYRGERPMPVLHDKTVILVDDGLATGATMQAAVAAVKAQHPAGVVVAVGAMAPDSVASLALEVDEVVAGIAPQPFYAVALWYEDFTAPTDAEVCDLLARAAASDTGALLQADATTQ